MTKRILVADDHPLFRGALRLAVEAAVASPEIVEACDLDGVLSRMASNSDFDLVLLDLAMPGASGFSGLLIVRAQFPAVPVIIVSGSAEAATVALAANLGASGFIPKTTDIATMQKAVAAVFAGESWFPEVEGSASLDQNDRDMTKKLARLTPQQLRVLMMLSDGLLNKQIAYKLVVSEATVKAHVSAILQKLDVDSRTQAVIAATRIFAARNAAA